MQMHMTEIKGVEEKVSHTITSEEECAFLRDFENLSYTGALAKLHIITNKICYDTFGVISNEEAADLILKNLAESVYLAVTRGYSIDDEALHAVENVVFTYCFGDPAADPTKLDSTMKEFVAHCELVKCAHLFEKLQKDKTFCLTANTVFNTSLRMRGLTDTSATKEIHDIIVAQYAFGAFMVFYSIFRIRDNLDDFWELDTLKETIYTVLHHVYECEQDAKLVYHAYENIRYAIHETIIVARDLYHQLYVL